MSFFENFQNYSRKFIKISIDCKFSTEKLNIFCKVHVRRHDVISHLKNIQCATLSKIDFYFFRTLIREGISGGDKSVNRASEHFFDLCPGSGEVCSLCL